MAPIVLNFRRSTLEVFDMASTNDFITHVLDMLGGLGDATSRAMFGAHGIYVDGMIVGLVEDDTLYLKVDDQNRGRFEDAGGAPFTYHDKAGQPRTMAYWTVPDHLLDDAGAMVEWGRTSLEAAMRAKMPGRKATGKAAAKGTALAAKTSSAPAKTTAKRPAPAAKASKTPAKSARASELKRSP